MSFELLDNVNYLKINWKKYLKRITIAFYWFIRVLEASNKVRSAHFVFEARKIMTNGKNLWLRSQMYPPVLYTCVFSNMGCFLHMYICIHIITKLVSLNNLIIHAQDSTRCIDRAKLYLWLLGIAQSLRQWHPQEILWYKLFIIL